MSNNTNENVDTKSKNTMSDGRSENAQTKSENKTSTISQYISSVDWGLIYLERARSKSAVQSPSPQQHAALAWSCKAVRRSKRSKV